MANTKKLSREKRKIAKRKARRHMVGVWGGLTREQRRKFLKSDEKSLKKFLVSIKPKEEEKPKEPAPAAPPVAAAPAAEAPAASAPVQPPAEGQTTEGAG